MYKKFTYLFIFISFFSFAQEKVKDSIKKIVETQIKTVEITAKKKLIEMKTDRLVFNVENSGLVSGGDGVDILSITPGLQVVGDQISMIGKSNMGIMVDGKILNISGEQLTIFLKSLKSQDVKSIEVITNPPAKYSAEGNSGLVNIILKKPKNDFWSFGITNAYQQATKAQNTTSLNFNYKKNKISLYSSMSYNLGKYTGKEYSEIDYPTTIRKSISSSIYKNNVLSGKLGLDYDITKKLQIGFLYFGNFSNPVTRDNNLTNTISQNDIQDNETYGNTKKNRNNNAFNIHSIYKIDSLGKILNFDFDFFKYTDNSNRNFSSYTDNILSSTSNQNINNSNQDIVSSSLNLDMTHPTKFATLNYGGRLVFSNTKNDLFSDIKEVGFSQNDLFKYKENTQALFLSAEKELSKKWSTQIGLRWENTQLQGKNSVLNQVNNKNYSKFFPTLYISYSPSENHSLSLQYGKRIDRPSFSNLNPFRIYYNPLSYWEGNPNLSPSYTHNIDLNYIYKGILQSVLSYEKTKDAFTGIVVLNSNDQTQKTTPLNYAETESYNFRQTYVFNKIKWLNANATIYAGYQIANSQIYPLTPKKIEGAYFIYTLNSSFILDKKTTIGFNISQYSPSKSFDLVYNKSRTFLNIYLQTKLWKNLNVSLNINNIIKEYQFNNISERNGYNNLNRGYYDSRYIRLTLSYFFGGDLNVKSREIKNQDEQNRIN